MNNLQPPRYTHDCSRCVYCGRDQQFDLYFCDQTVIARDGNEPGDYSSTLIQHALSTSLDGQVCEPAEATRRLAQQLLRDGLIRVEVDQHELTAYKLRIQRVEDWAEIVREFRKTTSGENADQEAWLRAVRYCEEECLSHLIPPPAAFTSSSKRENHFMDKIFGKDEADA